MRIALNRSAAGRMVFVARHYGDMVTSERDLKRTGVTDDGTMPKTRKMAGADYRLGGRLTSIDAVEVSSGTASRHHQAIFEMVDLETGQVIWGNMYEFRKAAQDDVIYR
jgi:hypothetical protein